MLLIGELSFRGEASGSDNYLKLAHAAGLGTFEHTAASHPYSSIDYRRIAVDLYQHIFIPLVNQP